jgi:aspartate/methionine/tyrosine aminotransferase
MSFPELARRLQAIAPFHVMELAKRAAALEKEGRPIINMGIGEPDFTAPPDVIEAAQHAMAQGRMQYTAATGLAPLRQAIADHYASRYQVQVDPARIIVTAGASGALLLACAALVEQGCEVLMPDPCYPCNRHFVAAFEGVARLVECGPEKRFQLSAEDIARHWTDKTRGVLLASPSNPTGTSILPDELARIVDQVRLRNGFTIVDEIYQGLSYDQAPVSALSLGEDVIVINSFSKYFNMTGWRLGWLVVPPAMVEQVEKLAQNIFICASGISQHAALGCFTPDSLDLYEERRNEFRRRRDYLVPALRELGFEIPVVPDGAFYVYVDCSRWTDDADKLSMELLEETGVALVPGLDFGPATARRYLRISYATSMENLHAAVARMKAYLANRPPRQVA